jgi:dTDP-4-dehydrorhamnose reductase
LVIGASGLVGQSLMRQLAGGHGRVVGTYVTQPRPGLIKLDMTDDAELGNCLEAVKPSVIYLSAALTQVDYCEDHPDEAYRENTLGPRLVAEAAARIGTQLVFYSTEYVFDGTAGPYDEAAATNPLSVYGRSKLAGENAIREFMPDALIVRTTVVYGWDTLSAKKNFAMQVYERVQNGQEMTIPEDQIGNPTLAEYLAQCSVALVERQASGVVNVVGKDLMPRTEFTRALVSLFGGDVSRVTPVTTASMKQKAPRPLRGGLRTEKLARLLGRDAMSLDDALQWLDRQRRAEQG